MIIKEYSTLLYEAIVYLALAFLIFLFGKWIYQLFHPRIKVKEELVIKDNLAFSLAHTGYFIGLLFAIGSAIVGPSRGLFLDMVDILTFGFLAIFLLNLSIWLNDVLLLRHFSVYKEIVEDRNAGTGIVEGAVAISSGLIIYGAVSGESGNIGMGLLTAVIFWAVGQVALLLTGWVYNKITPFDIHKEIEKDNVAVGIGFAGALIAIANLIRHGLSGDFAGWGYTFAETGLEVLIGLLILPIMRFLTDKILLPGQRLTDEIVNQENPNIGAAIIEAFAYIGGSILITWCL